ncbi:hypothetical protein FBU59_001523 [Linderina macrospora]|uniref:Uncharacterized protein n=1 Tax=Linderina macrospora TaxID=4868 RepID=A0ACC1JDW0_9FUNG|nr:hypothetical protein FBU59_001523 [Linderina macrospora]
MAVKIFARFEEFGPIEHAIVLTDRETGRSRGFGFVTFVNDEDAQRAIEGADGSEMDGRNIRVSTATERDPSSAPQRRPFGSYNNNGGGFQRRNNYGGNDGGYQRRNNYGGQQGGYQQQPRRNYGDNGGYGDNGYGQQGEPNAEY